MNLRSGVDLIEIERIRNAIERQGEHFLNRIYTPAELHTCQGSIPSLAARFAAKEAVSKALGTGFGEISWAEVEVLRGSAGEPVLHLHGKARRLAEVLNITHWTVSLSHTHEHAVAMAVAFGE